MAKLAFVMFVALMMWPPAIIADALTSVDFTPPHSFAEQVEGPATDRHGNLYAVGFGRKNTVGIVTPDGRARLFLQMPGNSLANGIRFSSNEAMLIADYIGHNILRLNAQGNLEVFANHPKMNQPNDLAIMDNDILFASDPNWKTQTGQLWRIDLAGMATCLADNLGTTNGIEVSPDNKTLYVNETIQRKVWAFTLDAAGNINNKRLLYAFEDFGLDGMRCDAAGNLYITRIGKGEVAIISPQGKALGSIRLRGKSPTNIAFGGQDGRTCYVTVSDRGNIETFRAEHPGRSWMMRQHRAESSRTQ